MHRGARPRSSRRRERSLRQDDECCLAHHGGPAYSARQRNDGRLGDDWRQMLEARPRFDSAPRKDRAVRNRIGPGEIDATRDPLSEGDPDKQ